MNEDNYTSMRQVNGLGVLGIGDNQNRPINDFTNWLLIKGQEGKEHKIRQAHTTADVFDLVVDDVNRLRDIYELSRDFRGGDKSKYENFLIEKAQAYSDALAKEMVYNGEYPNTIEGRADAQKAAEDSGERYFDYLQNLPYIEDLATTDKYVIDPQSRQYVPKNENNSNYPSTTGDLIQRIGISAGLDNTDELENLIAQSRGLESYPSSALNIAGSIGATLTLPRTIPALYDDEFFTKNGGSQAFNIGADALEQIITMLPWERLLRYAPKLGKIWKKYDEFAELNHNFKGSSIPSAFARGAKTALQEGTKTMIGDYAGAAADEMLGTNRGYEVNPAQDLMFGSAGGAIGGFFGRPNAEKRLARDLFDLTKKDPQSELAELRRQKGWKNPSQISEEYRSRYRGYKLPTRPIFGGAKKEVAQGTWANAPYQPFNDVNVHIGTDIRPNDNDDVAVLNRAKEMVLEQRQQAADEAYNKMNEEYWKGNINTKPERVKLTMKDVGGEEPIKTKFTDVEWRKYCDANFDKFKNGGKPMFTSGKDMYESADSEGIRELVESMLNPNDPLRVGVLNPENEYSLLKYSTEAAKRSPSNMQSDAVKSDLYKTRNAVASRFMRDNMETVGETPAGFNEARTEAAIRHNLGSHIPTWDDSRGNKVVNIGRDGLKLLTIPTLKGGRRVNNKTFYESFVESNAQDEENKNATKY